MSETLPTLLLGAVAMAPIFPMVLAIELPLYLLVIAGIGRHLIHQRRPGIMSRPYSPRVSCIVTCYSEGADARKTVECLLEQAYQGPIEVIAMVDGASKNRDTLRAVRSAGDGLRASPGRVLKCVPKWQRGGRVSSLNAGLSLARGDIVMALDGDTSFDDDMVAQAVARMADPRVIALTGTLRVRNRRESIWAHFQALEYLIGLVATRTGLAAFNVVNNVSGAFGVFRRDVLLRVGGWESGTAEDLDLTLRLQRYTGRHPDRIIAFEPAAIGHTDVPARFGDLLKQRLRWDGDLFYVYVRKHWQAFRPGILGWPRLIATAWYGLLHQIVLPFVIVIYLVWMGFTQTPDRLVIMLGLIYLLYLLIAAVMASVAIGLLSERRREDLTLLPALLLFPVFRGFMRVWSVVAILAEIVLSAHKDTSMAPWWVLKRSAHR